MRVALLDPGSEGLALAALLRGAGFDVELGSFDEVTVLSADVVVLAGDAPGALTALRALRDDGQRPDTPVVLVGAPHGTPPMAAGPAFGADWAIRREHVEAELAAAVRQVARGKGRLSDAPGLRERTLDLGDERSQVSAREPEYGSPEHGEPKSEEREPSSGEIEISRGSRSSDQVRAAEEGDSSSVELAFDAPVSPALAAVLLAADRRVFPHLPPTDPSLPRGEARAKDLVPEDLLYLSSNEPDEEPLLDALTFVGAVPEAAPLGAQVSGRVSSSLPISRASVVKSPSRTPAPHTPDRDARTPAARRVSERPPTPQVTAGGPSMVSLSRSTMPRADVEPRAVVESKGEGGLLAWTTQLRERLVSGAVQLTLTAPSGEGATLVLRDGHILDVAAPVARRVVFALDGLRADSEEAAADELTRREAAGLLSAFRLARLESAARRALLTELVAAPSVRYAISSVRELPTKGRPFARRILPLLVELAADAFGRAETLFLLGGPHARLGPTGTYALFARECELAPELDTVLFRPEGIEALLDRAWEAPLLPGALLVLVGVGALEVRAAEVHPPRSGTPHAIRAFIDALAQKSDEGDYFSLLGVGQGASAVEIAHAHTALGSRLDAIQLETLELTELSPRLAAARSAIDEAARVLSVERWRDAYRRSLVARLT